MVCPSCLATWGTGLEDHSFCALAAAMRASLLQDVSSTKKIDADPDSAWARIYSNHQLQRPDCYLVTRFALVFVGSALSSSICLSFPTLEPILLDQRPSHGAALFAQHCKPGWRNASNAAAAAARTAAAPPHGFDFGPAPSPAVATGACPAKCGVCPPKGSEVACCIAGKCEVRWC